MKPEDWMPSSADLERIENLPECGTDHQEMCKDHTLSVLRKLKRQASKYVGLASSRTAGYISDATLNEIIDEAIRNEGGEV